MMLPENTEREMRLQSLLVQLSKKIANFSSTEETKFGGGKNIHTVGKPHVTSVGLSNI